MPEPTDAVPNRAPEKDLPIPKRKPMTFGKLLLVGLAGFFVLMGIIGVFAKPHAQSFVPREPTPAARSSANVTPSPAPGTKLSAEGAAGAPPTTAILPPMADEATIAKYKSAIGSKFYDMVDSRSATAEFGSQVYWAPLREDHTECEIRLDPDLKITITAYMTKEEADESMNVLPVRNLFMRPAMLIQKLSSSSMGEVDISKKLAGAFVSARAASDFESYSTTPVSIVGYSVIYTVKHLRTHGNSDLIGLYQIDVQIVPAR